MSHARPAGMGSPAARRRVLVLYDPPSLGTNFVRDHLDSFGRFLPHDVWYVAATHGAPARFELDAFDVVVTHFTVRVALGYHLSPAFAARLRAFRGLKILFIQDEYDAPLAAARWARDTGLRAIFSCVPKQNREAFYPRAVCGDIPIISNLTGYVSPRLACEPACKSLADRPVVLSYRGRELPFRYGAMAREKYVIGVRMRAECDARGVRHDISWSDDARLYGDDWDSLLANSRAMLGTESGSNVVDPDGSLAATLDQARREDPALTYEVAFERFVRPHEGRVRMNQVPPKLFEAVAHRTALVLFEGNYSGVVRPDEHFIPLKKDFSNVGEVFDRLADVRSLEGMVERAHRDVVASGRYSYGVLMEALTKVIVGRPWVRRAAAGAVPACRDASAPHLYPHRRPIGLSAVPPRPLLSGRLRRGWLRVPKWVRWPVRWAVRPWAVAILRMRAGGLAGKRFA
jgi:hypothetical protein